MQVHTSLALGLVALAGMVAVAQLVPPFLPARVLVGTLAALGLVLLDPVVRRLAEAV